MLHAGSGTGAAPGGMRIRAPMQFYSILVVRVALEAFEPAESFFALSLEGVAGNLQRWLGPVPTRRLGSIRSTATAFGAAISMMAANDFSGGLKKRSAASTCEIDGACHRTAAENKWGGNARRSEVPRVGNR